MLGLNCVAKASGISVPFSLPRDVPGLNFLAKASGISVPSPALDTCDRKKDVEESKPHGQSEPE